MTSPLFKWTVRIVAAVMIVAILVIAMAALVMNTEAGTRWAIGRLDSVLEGDLDAGDFEGTLLRGMRFHRLSYRDSDREIDAINVELAIEWSTLAAGRLTIWHLDADALDYRAPGDAEPAPFKIAMQPLPVDISLTRASIDDLKLTTRDSSREVARLVVEDARLDNLDLSIGALSAVTSGIIAELSSLSMKLRDDVRTNAGVRFSQSDGPWSGRGKVAGSLAELSFDAAVAGPYPGIASGVVRLLHRIEPEIEALLNWERWSVGDYELLDGEINVRGLPASFTATYDATVSEPGGLRFNVNGAAAGNTERLDTVDAVIQGTPGVGRLTGSLTWTPAFAAEAFADVNATLHGVSAHATGSLSWAQETLVCAGCVLQAGDNRLDLDGKFSGDRLDATLSGNAPTLAQLWPGLSGAARVKGTLSGPLRWPLFRGELRLTEPAYGDWSAGSIRIDSAVAGLDKIDITARVDALERNGATYGTLLATARGSPTNANLSARWTRGELDGQLSGVLRVGDDEWVGEILATSVSEPNTGLWNLTEPFGFRFAAGTLDVGSNTWSNDQSELRISQLIFTDSGARIAADLGALPLQLANPWLPPNMELLGSADASVDLNRDGDVWNGSVDWRQTGTILRVAALDDQVTDVVVPRAEVSAVLRNNALEGKAFLSIDPEVSGELEFQLAALEADAAVRAELRVRGDSWDWVSAIVPELDRVKGSVEALVRAEGPLGEPELLGDVNWRRGQVRIPALNVPLSDIDVVVSGGSEGTATLTGRAKAGDGRLAVTGRFDNLMQAERSVQLQLTGKGAEVISWPEYKVWATPDLSIVGDRAGWRFDGPIEVPRAAIEIRDLPVEAVPVSADVVILGDDAPVRAATRVSGETRLTIGDRVRVRALGLDTGLSGTLLIRVIEGAPVSAQGTISLVDGVFSGYGQNLTIRKGELSFTGPLDDPLVDVTAIRVIETLDGPVTAGIQLRGRAQNLTSTVFSEPAMAEADALSYLVIGRPLNQATEAEGGDLSGAALALGIKQAARLTEQIAQTLGLDQLSLTGDGGDTTALVAGKQVNSRLYARYAYGVFSRLGILLLRYKLSERVSLEASTGENQSIDILYSVEKD